MAPETATIDGKPSFRLAPDQPWCSAGNHLDNLLLYAALVKRLSKPKQLIRLLGWDSGRVSRVRHEHEAISKSMLLDLHEFTGIPVKYLRIVANLPGAF